MLTLARVLGGLSGLLLLLTAYFHSTGIDGVRAAVEKAQMTGFFAEAFPVLWLFFSWHLMVIAMPLLWAAIKSPSWFFQACIFCGLVALGDFFWVFSLAGWFPGTIILLSVVGLLLAVCVILTRKQSAAR